MKFCKCFTKFSGDLAHQVSSLSSPKHQTKMSPEILDQIVCYAASHRFILIPLLFCPSHRLLCIDISFPCLLCLLSLFLFYFFTATRDFHSADSWADSWTVVNCPRYREIQYSNVLAAEKRALGRFQIDTSPLQDQGREMSSGSDWFQEDFVTWITFEMDERGRNQKKIIP